MRPLCLVLLLGASLLPAAAAGLPDFLPTNTKVLIGVRLGAITASPLFQAYASQTMSAGSDWMNMSLLMGFNPLKDIDELLVATTAGGQNAPALLVIHGRFDVERLSAGARRYHGVPLLPTSHASDSFIALLDTSTAITGQAELVRSAIDRRGKGDSIAAGLADRAEALRNRYDIWGVGEVAEGVKAPAGPAVGLDSIDRFQFGLVLSHGIEASAELHARSAKDLEKLAGSLRIFTAALMNQAKQSSSAVKLDTRVNSNTLNVSLVLPEDELRQALQARRAAMAFSRSGSGVAVTGTPVASSPNAAPSRRATSDPDSEADTVVLRLPGKR